MGFSDERGDVIEVQNFAFRSPLEDIPEEEISFWKSPEILVLLPTAVRGATVLAGLLLLGLLVIRPVLNQLASGPIVMAGTQAGGMAEGGVLSLTPEQQALELKEQELAIPIAKDQAKQVADAMKLWLRE